MHLADDFIQSDLHCIQVTVSTFYQLLLSLGIEPMILALLTPCSTSWATGKLIYLTHILSLHINSSSFTCTYKTVHCYILVHTIVSLYIVIPYLLVLFNSSFYYLCFYSLTVILLHFCHENKFLVCVNIPGNKAHSDSDADAKTF